MTTGVTFEQIAEPNELDTFETVLVNLFGKPIGDKLPRPIKRASSRH